MNRSTIAMGINAGLMSALLIFGIHGTATAYAAPSFCDSNHEDQGVSPSDHEPGRIYIAACGPENTGNGGCDDASPGCTKHDSNSGGDDDGPNGEIN